MKKPDASSGGKPIKYYRLTKKGCAALEALKKQNEMMWKGFKTAVFKDKTAS